MKLKKVTFPLIWIVLFLGGSMISLFFTSTIQAHHLSQALIYPYDAFGRNMVFLTFNAAALALFEAMPLASVATFLSILIASMLSFSKKQSIFHQTLQTLIDTLNALPGFLIALCLGAIDTRLSTITVTLIMIVPYLIRYFEGSLNSLLKKLHFQSAIALGASHYRLFKSEMLPEVIDRAIFIQPFIFQRLLLIAASLQFLGLQDYSFPETWGQILNQGREYMIEAPWILAVGGTPFIITLMSFHLLSQRQSR